MDRRASIDVRQAYEVIAVIGQGTQATVKLARHRATQTLVAMKSISKPLRTDNVDIGDKSLPLSSASSPGGGHGVGQNFQAVRENVLVECRILEQMDGHPCIPRFYELLESSTSWHVVQELIRGPVSGVRRVSLAHDLLQN
jgi:serine/threonine protein kinase